jgi:hypothetical protein
VRRRAAVVVGVTAVIVGLALTLRPDLLGFDLATAFAVVVWALALAGAAVAVHGRLTAGGGTETPLPRASERPDYDVPGDDFAARVADLGAGERDADARDRVRDRLRETVVDAVVRFGGVSRSTARERVDEGTWTDDPAAADLFDDGTGRPGGREGVETGFDRRVERVADAVADDVAELGRTDQGERDGGVYDEQRRGETGD